MKTLTKFTHRNGRCAESKKKAPGSRLELGLTKHLEGEL
jgi:hypothetical protein